MSNTSFYNKYLKYKKKYLDLKNKFLDLKNKFKIYGGLNFELFSAKYPNINISKFVQSNINFAEWIVKNPQAILNKKIIQIQNLYNFIATNPESYLGYFIMWKSNKLTGYCGILNSILPLKNNQLLYTVNIDPVYNYSLNYDGSLNLFCSNEICEINISIGTEITIIYNFSEPIIDNKKIKKIYYDPVLTITNDTINNLNTPIIDLHP